MSATVEAMFMHLLGAQGPVVDAADAMRAALFAAFIMLLVFAVGFTPWHPEQPPYKVWPFETLITAFAFVNGTSQKPTSIKQAHNNFPNHPTGRVDFIGNGCLSKAFIFLSCTFVSGMRPALNPLPEGNERKR